MQSIPYKTKAIDKMNWLIDNKYLDEANDIDKKLINYFRAETDENRLRNIFYILMEWQKETERILKLGYQDTKKEWEFLCKI